MLGLPALRRRSGGVAEEKLTQISKLALSEIPRRRGRKSPLEPVARLVRALQPQEALRIPCLDMDDARAKAKSLGRMLRYGGLRPKFRTFPEELYVWRAAK